MKTDNTKKSNIILSVVVPTLNNEKDIERFLSSICKQDMEQDKIEILIADGGSQDKTVNIAKKYKAKVIHNKYVLADPGVNLGLQEALGKFIIVLAADNIFKDRSALNKMITVFNDKTIMAAFPVHVSSKNDSFFTKYINFFTDPFSHFVYGYAANGRTFSKIYKTIEHNNVYDVYDYNSNVDKPLIAMAQGFMVRGNFQRIEKQAFDDITPVLDLLQKNKKIAFVHSVGLYHHTVRDFKHFVKKQMWASVNTIQKKSYGISYRTGYLSKNQNFRMKIWPIYALSFVFPCMRSIYGLVVDNEVMWIFHPFLCMISAWSSIGAIAMYYINSKRTFTRQ